jgi:endonuclease YncB( thermonuclease family)
MIRPLFLALAIATALQSGCTTTALPEQEPQQVVWHCLRVIDGDTLVASRTDWPGAEIHIRLWGVDAPEHNLPGGAEATAATRAMVEGKDFTIIGHGREKYGRDLDEVFVEGKSVETMLLTKHLAVAYFGGHRNPQLVSETVMLKQGDPQEGSNN